MVGGPNRGHSGSRYMYIYIYMEDGVGVGVVLFSSFPAPLLVAQAVPGGPFHSGERTF